jgi:hypothetical protein
MLHFHIWCNLNEGQDETGFCGSVQEFLSYLHAREQIEGYAMTRRQFMIAPPDLGKFHITIDFATLEQVNLAFEMIAAQPEEFAEYHKTFEAAVRSISTAMYKDFPEPRRPKKRMKDEG